MPFSISVTGKAYTWPFWITCNCPKHQGYCLPTDCPYCLENLLTLQSSASSIISIGSTPIHATRLHSKKTSLWNPSLTPFFLLKLGSLPFLCSSKIPYTISLIVLKNSFTPFYNLELLKTIKTNNLNNIDVGYLKSLFHLVWILMF